MEFHTNSVTRGFWLYFSKLINKVCYFSIVIQIFQFLLTNSIFLKEKPVKNNPIYSGRKKSYLSGKESPVYSRRKKEMKF